MFVDLCISDFIELINRTLVHKFQVKSDMINASKWHKIKTAVKWMIDMQSGGKKQETGLHVLKVSSIPAFLFLTWNYCSLLINFYFFAGEICALKWTWT